MAEGSDDAGLGAAMDAVQGAAAAPPPPGGSSPAAPPASGPAAAPAGPPRLRGQARVPPPAPDDLSLGAVAKGAWENLPSSVWHNVQQTITPLLPQMWGQDWESLKALATDPAARARVAAMYKQRYASVPGFLSTLKHDPAAIGSDVAALATIPVGGEGLAAKVPGVAGDVLGAAAKAGKVAQLADPTYALATGAGAVARGVGKVAPAGGLVRHAIGTGVGGALGAAIPIPHVGPYIGMGVGNYLADKVLPHALPGGGIAARAGRALTKALPAATELGGMQSDNATPGAAPGAGAPGPAAQAGPVSPEQAQVNDMLQALEGGGGQSAGAAPPAAPAPRGAIYDHIANVASQAGANPQEVAYLQRTAQIESGGDPNATSPTGRYHGLFQYPGQMNVDDQIVRALQDARAHGTRLGALGVDATPANLYIAHQQGAGGGPALLRAARDNPDVSAVDALLPAYHGNRRLALSAIVGNVGRGVANAASMTAGEFVRYWQNRFGGGDRVPFAAGGQVGDLTEKLLQRAGQAQRASQSSTKPLLRLSDDTVARALAVAQAAI